MKKLTKQDMEQYLGTSDGIGFEDRLDCWFPDCGNVCPHFDGACSIGATWQEPEPRRTLFR